MNWFFALRITPVRHPSSFIVPPQWMALDAVYNNAVPVPVLDYGTVLVCYTIGNKCCTAPGPSALNLATVMYGCADAHGQ